MKKFFSNLLSAVVSAALFILAGCAIITPTVVPPLTERLGYTVPNIYGVTTVGMIKGSLRVEQEKLRVFDAMATLTLEATEKVKTEIIDIVAMLGLGGTATLPWALKKVPKGYRKEESDVQSRGESRA